MIAWLGPEELAGQVPAWHGQDVSVVKELDGLNNRSWLMEVSGERFVLRVDLHNDAGFERNRITELMVQDRAAKQGLAPEVVFAHPGSGLIVTRYLDGEHLNLHALTDVAVQELAALLRRVHELPRSGRRFNAVAAAESYFSRLREDDRRTGERCLNILASATEPRSVTLCHNDLVCSNIIVGRGMRLIDWEYACDNDPLFDLATIVAHHELDSADAQRLLAAYGDVDGRDLPAELPQAVRAYDALHWLWAAARRDREDAGSDAVSLDRIAGRLFD